MTEGVALTNASIKGWCNPLGVVAGAMAMNKLTLRFKEGLMDNAEKACAVPCEKPMYVKLGAPVISKIYYSINC